MKKIKKIISMFVLGLMVSQCITAPKDSTYRFPEHFMVSQKLQLNQNGRVINLISQLNKSGDDLDIALISPAFHLVLLKIKMNKYEKKVVYQNPLTKKLKVPSRVLSFLYDLYQDSYNRHVKNNYKGSYYGRKTWIENVSRKQGCDFPASITVINTNGEPFVKANNYDLDCRHE